jgi:transcriptional regulator with XRE-family HTH domain
MLVSTYSQLSWIYRRAMCTGENMNMVRRSSVSPYGPLIPAAVSGEQRHFEANFLLRWAESTGFAPAKKGLPVPSFISATHPAPDCLAITVSYPMMLMTLLHHVLPRWVNDRVVGTPGLRVYPWRDFLELRMLGAENDVRARIRLFGVNRSRHQGREFLAEAVRYWPACRPLYLERTLFPGELSSVSASATWRDSLLSDLLRRFPLWRTADLVSVGLTADTASVSWQGGPSSATILAVLGSPSCGVPYRGTELLSTGGGHGIAFLDDRATKLGVVEPSVAWEAIHTAQTVHAKRVAVAPRFESSSAWEDPEMRSALAAREVSTIYRLLRRRGVSQRQIAAMTGQSQSEVSEILKGRQVMAYDVLVRIADGLGVPRGYMGLAYEELTAARVAEPSESPEAEEPENVKRRKFLAHAAAVAVGAHVLGADSGSWVSNPVLTPAPGRIGMTDVRQVEAATRALRSLDYQYGGGFCRDAAAAQTLWVEGLLARAEGAEVRGRLEAAISELDAIGASGLWLPNDRWIETGGEHHG